MKQIFKMIWPIIVGVIIATVSYAFGTYRSQKAEGNLLQTMFIQSSASTLGVHVKALEKYRSGEQEKAIELLEKLVDLDLMNLAAYAQVIKKGKNEEIIDNVKEAKAYRARYPQHKVMQNISTSVSKGLDLAK